MDFSGGLAQTFDRITRAIYLRGRERSRRLNKQMVCSLKLLIHTAEQLLRVNAKLNLMPEGGHHATRGGASYIT